MDTSEIVVTLLVPLLSLLATVMVNRQSAKASKSDNATAVTTTTISSRTDLETEAYTRARTLDTETIKRQADEIVEIREKYDKLEIRYDVLEDKYDELLDENRRLKKRVADLEEHERISDDSSN